MVRDIVKDTEVLSQISSKAVYGSKEANQVIQDLIDTAKFHESNCAGLAAIQINEPTRIIVVFNGQEFVPYVNPTIISYSGRKYEADEGCLSLEGIRQVMRYPTIVLMHQKGKKFVREKFSGFYAEVIQHEVDHLQGKLI